MFQNLTQAIRALPPDLATFLLSMTPYGELRLSIPVGYLVFDLPILQVFIISVIGNMIPPILILLLAEYLDDLMKKRTGFWGAKWAITLNKVRAKFDGKYEKWGLLGLLLFVSAPIPTTGAWTGALIAFLFGFPVKKSLLMIFGGVVIAGVIVSAVVSLPALF